MCAALHRVMILSLREVGWVGREWIDLAQERGQVARDFEYGNELSGFIKCGEYLDWLRTC